MMKTIEINLGNVRTREEFHEEVSQKLNFPDYYGKNLDAMYDCLTDILEPMEINFYGVEKCRASSSEMSKYIESLKRMLDDASDVADNLVFNLLDEEKAETCDGRASAKSSAIRAEGNVDSVKEALKSVGISEGDSVFVSGFASPYVLEAVRELNLVPIPIDIASENYGIEARLIDFALDKMINEGLKTPRAIILSKTFGIILDTSVIESIADDRGLAVVIEGDESIPEEEADYRSRLGEAYAMAIKLRFGKGSTRVWPPRVPSGIDQPWKAFPVRFASMEARDGALNMLSERGIEASAPSLGFTLDEMSDIPVCKKVAETTLVLPVYPDMVAKDIVSAVDGIWEYFGKPEAEEDLNPFSGIHSSHPEYGIR